MSDQGSGLVDMDLKEAYETKEEAERSKELFAKAREALPAATLESASFEDIGSFDERATIKYRLKVPGYATAAGDRMVLAPALLEAGRPALFTAEKRRTPVQFPHRQRTVERIVFTLPDGYAVDQLPKVGVVREGPLMLMTTYAEEEEGLVVSRRLDLEAAVWPAEDYAKLKAFFERVHEVDQQVVVLKKVPKP